MGNLFANCDYQIKNIKIIDSFRKFANIIICSMVIKARIEKIINQKGLTKVDVSERMGKFNQAFNFIINPKWDTIELVAEAIGITTKELLFGCKDLPAKTDSEKESKERSSHNSNQQISTLSFGLIICPYCGRGIRLSIEKG